MREEEFRYSKKCKTHHSWLCEKCGNFTDADDNNIREITETEQKGLEKELEDFERDTVSLPKEKMTRRKGVN